MSQNVAVCTIDEDLKNELKKFRYSKAKEGCAIIMKVDKDKQMIIEEEKLEDCSVDELRESLPTHQPRFIAYSFCHNHSDGRVSYPMVFLFSTPPGGQIELSVMYAGSKNNLVKETGMTKLLEVRDMEDLTEEWVKDQLKLK
eukprot:GFUD01002061.1.p1 GENE.GFUD01002061.1~~GFUD01002061.1.p1  ORF type:complete len:142 (+),score=56.47 GFUD01002061.1:126-551(+)